MRSALTFVWVLMAVSAAWGEPAAQEAQGEAVPVTADNFVRAESDLYLGGAAKDYGFGRVGHTRSRHRSISRP